jgi:uncharacterized protein
LRRSLKWQSVGRLVPLHWNHRGDDIVGHVDPAQMVETRDGLEVSGRVDLDTERGRGVWRQIKADRVGFSFGFLATRSGKRSDGSRELLEVDVYEVSVTPSPMNNRTRVLDTKSATTETRHDLDPRTGRLMNVAELHEHTKAMAKRTEPIRIVSFEC